MFSFCGLQELAFDWTLLLSVPRRSLEVVFFSLTSSQYGVTLFDIGSLCNCLCPTREQMA